MNTRTAAAASLLILLALAPLGRAEETAKSVPATPAAPASTAPATDLAALGASLASAFGSLLDQSTPADTTAFNLPDTLARIQAAAKVAGKSESVDQLAAKLNTASGDSYSSALGIVKSALSDVPWTEAKNLQSGGNDAVTAFIRKSAGKKLRAQLLPVVKKSVAAAGVPEQYKQLLAAAGPAASLFGKPGVSDLEGYVTDKTLDAVFGYLAKQEAALRANPAVATNPTVQKAFALLTAAK